MENPKGGAVAEPRGGGQWSRSIVLWGRRVAPALAGLVAVPVLVLAASAMLNPASNAVTMVSNWVWPAVGPQLVLLSALAFAVALAGMKWGPRRTSRVVAALAALGVVVTTAIVSTFAHAAYRAGGSVNPVSALWSVTPASEPDRTTVFDTVDGKELRALVYEPADGGDGGSAPMMVYIHGGGWIGGSVGDASADLRHFADEGWLVVSVEYRLASANVATWDKAPRDVACALAWAGENADSLGGDGDRIVVAGDSAGGNLAVNLAYSAARSAPLTACGRTVPVPRAVVVQYPVVDPRDAYDNGYPVPGAEPKAFTSDYIGGLPEAHPERMRAISSDTYIGPSAPPTLIIEPMGDGFIPANGVLDFADRAQRAGVDVTVARLPFAGHGYDSGALGNQARRSITENYLAERDLAPRSHRGR